jgi:TolB-like protein
MRTPTRNALVGAIVATTFLQAQDRDIKALATTFADALARASKKTVAVVDFNDLQGNVTELGRYLSEQVSVSLAMTNKGIEVVDRTHLKTLLQEYKLNASGLIDPATARKLGQIAGVEVLVTGTLTPLGDSVQLAVKALDTNTARIVTASVTDIAKTKAIEELLNRGVGGGAASGLIGSTGGPLPATAVNSPDQTRSTSGVVVRLNSCALTKGALVCDFTVTSQQGDQRLGVVGSRVIGGLPISRAIDDQGNVYPAVESQLGDRKGEGIVSNLLTAGIPMIARVGFQGSRQDVALLVSVELTLVDTENQRFAPIRFQFRNVRVVR